MLTGNITSTAFDETYFQIIKQFEGWEDSVEPDPLGVPTIGYGVALVVKGDDPVNPWEVRAQAQLNDWFAGIYTFSAAEIQTLQDCTNILNGSPGNVTKLIASSTLSSSPVLTEEQGRTVLIRAAEDIASDAIPEDIRLALAGTRELAILYSLAYNAPGLVGPKLEAAIRAGDRAEAWFEIRYNSGAALDERRHAESQLFGLFSDNSGDTPPSLTEALLWSLGYDFITDSWDLANLRPAVDAGAGA